ncbi:uncharacterized protein UTRI_04841 [Ustilago trichophora]|uniref:Uncharacterized protein n=1 Tax=Ustilago trichophora TaxID=86804 RepID=A0A5C3ECP3_9BASI|nr:uncharacterized protein UTRI_04841 [Ustilago trichophora]
MAAGSRKRRRPDGRTASPPLAPSPLLTRNLQLLPVGLTQLPNDEHFVTRLRHDLDDLLSAFAEAFLLVILAGNNTSNEGLAALSSRNVGTSLNSIQVKEHVKPSPFSIFAHLWRQKGWHLIQFTFADHADSKRSISDAICRVLLEYFGPFVAERSQHNSDVLYTIAFANLKHLFKIMAAPFALYLLWSTQIYPTSGIGVKHCRPAMERIPIEQDCYDFLLELPDAVLKHLQDEQKTQPCSEAITADLIEVICRLVGQPLDETRSDAISAEQLAKTQATHSTSSSRSKRRQDWQDSPDEGNTSQTDMDGSEPVLDIIPASILATRLPRTWPSVRVMSSLEANKQFGRVGSIVRITPRETDAAPSPYPQPAAKESSSSRSAIAHATETREKVAGLSRGDVIRLKARQRLAMASIDLSKLLRQQASGTTIIATAPPSLMQVQVEPSDLLAQHTAQPASPSTHRARYEIDTPTWITSSRYTAKLKPWLEQSSTPMQQSLNRATRTKDRYLEMRGKIMPSSSSVSSNTQEEDGEEAAAKTDFGDWVLQSFRQERIARREHGEGSSSQAVERSVEKGTEGLPAVDAEGSLSLDSLYKVAAERTKTAAVQRGETLKSAKPRTSRPK